MKKIILALATLSAAHAQITLSSGSISSYTNSANFDTASGSLGSVYDEGGIAFTSSLLTASTFGLYMESDGTPNWESYNNPFLVGGQNDWIGISLTDGAMISSLSFEAGNDWSQISIESGFIEPYLDWETFSNGALVGSGSLATGLDFGSYYTISDLGDTFDQVLLRSTAIATVGSNPNYYGNENLLSLDNVRVQDPPTSIPDRAGTWILLGVALIALATWRVLGRKIAA